jgi:hypothetical protein
LSQGFEEDVHDQLSHHPIAKMDVHVRRRRQLQTIQFFEGQFLGR